MTRGEFKNKYLDIANKIRDERTEAETLTRSADKMEQMTGEINILVLPKMLAIVLEVIEDIKELE